MLKLRELFKILLVGAACLFGTPVLAETTNSLSTFVSDSKHVSYVVEPSSSRISRVLSQTQSEPLNVQSTRTDRIRVLNAKGEQTNVVPIEVSKLDDGGERFGYRVRSVVGEEVIVINQTESDSELTLIESRNGAATLKTTKLSELSPFLSCGLHDAARFFSRTLARADSSALLASQLSGSWREVEVLLVAPSEFVGTRSDEEIVTQITSLIAGANIYYEALHLVLKISAVQIYRAPSEDPLASVIATKDANEILNKAIDFYQSRPLPQRDIIAVLGRGKFFDGPSSGGVVYGLAYAAVSCVEPVLSAAFAAQGGDTAAGRFGLIATLAHEIGHNIGMGHDDSLYNGIPSLMYSFFATNVTGFSGLSISEYQRHAATGGSQCFSELPDYVPPAHPDDPSTGGGPTVQIDGLGVPVLKVKEGELLQFTLMFGGVPSNVTLFPDQLPIGSSYNNTTGVFSYRPEYDVVPSSRRSVSYPVRFVSGGISRSVRIEVLNVNRPPSFGFITQGLMGVKAGEKRTFRFPVSEDDSGDRLAVRLKGGHIPKVFRGAKLSMRGGEVVFSFSTKRGAKRRMPVTFVVTDRAGAKAVLPITFDIRG